MTDLSPVLLIAYDYPPCHSAGVQRILKFTEHLPNLGFKPIVLTTTAWSYNRTDQNLTIPPDVEVYRSPSIDVSRHLSFRGKYLEILATPDRYSSWFPIARLTANYIIRKHQPRIIFSTFPFTSNHMVALSVYRKAGIPLIAEYRDPAPFHYMSGKFNDLSRKIDRDTVHSSEKVIFATNRMRKLYASIYPSQKDKFEVIENGFNEQIFNLASSSRSRTPLNNVITILHSGAFYKQGRDPLPLVKAVHHLVSEGRTIDPYRLRVIFRGSAPHAELADYVLKNNLQDTIHFKKSVQYNESIDEMLNTDILLLLQGELFKYQIPGKAYEYLATNKTILSLSPVDSATHELMHNIDGVYCANDNDSTEIKNTLIEAIRQCRTKLIKRDLSLYSRQSRSLQLATLFQAQLNISTR